MLDFVLNILGKGDTSIPEDASVNFSFRYAPESWRVFVFIAVLAAILYGVWWLYHNENQRCSRRARSVLTTLRICIVLLAVVIFLGPTITYSTRKMIKSYVLVLLDESLSMSIQDDYEDDMLADSVASVMSISPQKLDESPPSRAAILNRILTRDNNQFVRKLQRIGHVRILSFSDSAKLRASLEAEGPEAMASGPANNTLSKAQTDTEIPSLNPSGTATNMADAITKAHHISAGRPLAGIVLISDGQNNAGENPNTAARHSGSQDVPIFTAGIGNPSEPQNIRVMNLWAPKNTFQDEAFELKMSIRASGLKGEQAEIILRQRKAEDSAETENGGTVLDRRHLDIKDGMQTVTFEHIPQKTGNYIFSVEIPSKDNELLTTDNDASTAVNVVKQEVRVLLIAGSPSWSYRLVKNLFIREDTIDVSCWLQTMSTNMEQEGNTIISELPRTREKLFSYDAIMLFDPDPRAFNADWIENLQTFMDNHGGGIWWMAGPLHTIDFLTESTTRDIQKLLPVRFGDVDSGFISDIANTHSREWPLKVPPEATHHPVLQPGTDTQDTQAGWNNLPGVYWSLPANAVKPGAELLVEHTNPVLDTQQGARPLLVAGHYGAGRSLYIGFTGTWRWRRSRPKFFETFWIHAIRYLTRGRLTKGRERGRILTNQDSYSVGDEVLVSAKLYDASYQPLERDEVSAELKAPKSPSRSLTLRSVREEEGRFEGAVQAHDIGINQIVVSLNDDTGEGMPLRRQFRVTMPNAELQSPRMNRQLLVSLAEKSRGEYFPLNRVDTISESIPDRQKTTIVSGRPITLWDTSRIFILIVVLFSLEWALRKRYGLV